MSIFLIDYQTRTGRTRTARIEADDWEDAEQQFEALTQTGEVVGELIEEGEVDKFTTGQIGRA